MVQKKVVFDVSPDAQVNRVLQNPRTILACTYKCFCNYRETDLSHQPTTYPQPQANGGRWTGEPWQFRSGDYDMYQMSVDRFDDNNVPQTHGHPGMYGSTRIDGVELYRDNHGIIGILPYRRLYISHDKENRIECLGNLPPFGLPSPYTLDRYANLQELCASRLSGGYPAANAGGYCHRTSAPGAASGLLREVWFSDEITPRYEWTWNNFVASLGIRFYCYQRCACSYRPSKSNSTAGMWMNRSVKIWRFLDGTEASQAPDGSLSYGPSGSSTSTGQILPAPGLGGAQHAGTCGPNGTDFCPSPWPTALLGPVQQMQRPPKPVLEVTKPKPGSHELTTCGNFCQSARDCGEPTTEAAAGGYSCACAVPSADQARLLGLDAVLPAAVCLALMAVQSVSKPIHGRDFGVRSGGLKYVDQSGEEYQCICNSTTVSSTCCGSSDGIV